MTAVAVAPLKAPLWPSGDLARRRRGGLPLSWAANKHDAVPRGDDESFRPLARLVDADSPDLDAIACASDDHIVVFVTGLVTGRREVVGLEIRPTPKLSGADMSSWLDAWLRRALDDVRSAQSLQPVGANMVRQLPFSTLLSFRNEAITQDELVAAAVERMGRPMPAASSLNADDRKRLAYLDDAETYVAAAREGLSPAAVIAQARGVAHGTAANRIARARALGLLSVSEGPMIGGSLTPDAVRLLEWRKS